MDGYWDELVGFTRSLFNSTFKTNPALERGIMTGITRVSLKHYFVENVSGRKLMNRLYTAC